MYKSKSQSMSFRNGSGASDSFLAASPISSPDGTDAAGAAEGTCFIFTTSLDVKNAEYAFSAPLPCTRDFLYAGSPSWRPLDYHRCAALTTPLAS